MQDLLERAYEFLAEADIKPYHYLPKTPDRWRMVHGHGKGSTDAVLDSLAQQGSKRYKGLLRAMKGTGKSVRRNKRTR